MADQATLEAIETAELITMVDTGRAPADPFKLQPSILTLLTARLTDTKAKNAGADMTGAATIGASGQRQQALDRLGQLLRNGYNGIAAVASDDISDAERDQVYAAYGWEQGLIGDMESLTRIEALANTAVAATADPSVPAVPAHASYLRSYRQPAGGAKAVAGVSNSGNVSIVGISPLTPGVSYETWAVGVNSRGEGPATNKITFTA